jgi:hypothetical protein
VADGFIVTMRVVPYVKEDSQGVPVVCAQGFMGLDYLSARWITEALVGRPSSGIVLREHSLVVALPSDGDVPGAIEVLVRYASEQAFALVGVADLDVKIEMLSVGAAVPVGEPAAFVGKSSDSPTPPGLVAAALLAGAGRHDEARRVLSEVIGEGEEVSPSRQRLVRQLIRWSDGDGKLVLPSSPAQWGHRREWITGPPSTLRDDMHEHREEASARQQAVNAVRTAHPARAQATRGEHRSAETRAIS